jgi:GntR family transcriptional regulator / MocR family aminotransferase
VADLDGVDAARVFEEAMARGVEVMPLAAYVFGSARAQNALILGFGGVDAEAIGAGMKTLAAALDSARIPRATAAGLGGIKDRKDYQQTR